MQRRLPLFPSLLGAVVLSQGAQAADEDIFFNELPVVATVSRLPQRLADAPTSVTVIDRETLRAMPIRDLNDILRLVPGFQTYPNTTETGRVVYHGLTDEEFSPRLQVLVDGRSMYSPAFRGGVNWALIPVALEDIERIEVVRGTNAVSYGSNAFLGVVNIVTTDPSLTRGVSVGVRHGNQNVRDHSLRVGGRLGEAGDFRLTYQHQNDDGLSNHWDWVDSYGKQLVDFRGDLALSNIDSLQISLGRVDANNQRGRLSFTGGQWISNPNNPVRAFDQTSMYAQFRWLRSLSGGGEFSLRYAYTQDEGDEGFDKTKDGMTYRYNPWGTTGQRHEVEFQHVFSLTQFSRLAWGGSWRRDQAKGETILAGQGWVGRNISRSFVNLEWKPLAYTTFNFGLAGEYDSLAGSNLSPRLSAAYHLNERNTVRFGASRAYRTGSIIDYRGEWWDGAKYQFAGNPNMPSERMDTLELGYLGDWRDLRMSLDVRVFHEKISGRLLEIDRDDQSNLVPNGMYPVQNIEMKGLEYQFKWQPWQATRLIFNQTFINTQAQYTEEALANRVSSLWNDRQDLYPVYQGVHDLAMQAAPKRSTSLFLMQKLPFNLEFSLAGYWQTASKWSINTASRAYHRYDVRLAYPFRLPGGQRGELSCVSQSINGDHAEYKAYGQPHDRVVERRTWLALRFDI